MPLVELEAYLSYDLHFFSDPTNELVGDLYKIKNKADDKLLKKTE